MIENFMMNSHSNDLQVDNLGQARRYFRKMREVYHHKLNEYVQELTFISEKLARYDKLVF